LVRIAHQEDPSIDGVDLKTGKYSISVGDSFHYCDFCEPCGDEDCYKNNPDCEVCAAGDRSEQSQENGRELIIAEVDKFVASKYRAGKNICQRCNQQHENFWICEKCEIWVCVDCSKSYSALRTAEYHLLCLECHLIVAAFDKLKG